MFFVYTSISAVLMLGLLVIIWYKKIWDIFATVLDADPTMIRSPDSRFNRKIYGFSYNIMSSAFWRTIIYLFVVSILFVVSLLHLVSDFLQCYNMCRISHWFELLYLQIEGCSDYIRETETHGRKNVTYESKREILQEYPLCLNSWVRHTCESKSAKPLSHFINIILIPRFYHLNNN